ncbi:MAG: helix-turn-helix domain-containing protein [Hyphomicrobiaceae bacterium]
MSMQTIAYARPSTQRFGQPKVALGGFEQSLAHGQLRRVESKEFLFAEGDTVSHVYRIETGALALYRVLSDGRRQVMGFAYPGEIVGLGIDGTHTMNAQAVKPTRVRCVTIASLRQSAATDPALGFRLYEAMARELAATRDLMLTTGQRSASERVAGFILALSRRNERNGQDARCIDLPMTRADIGDFLGLTIETVSRTFSKFRLMKLVDLPHSSQVHILDIAHLRELADGGC